MKAERPLNVIFYQTSAGNEPVRQWLKGLPAEERKTIGADILSVQYAWPVGKPLVDNLGDGVWEIRSRLPNRIARTLFAVADEELCCCMASSKNSSGRRRTNWLWRRNEKKNI